MRIPGIVAVLVLSAASAVQAQANAWLEEVTAVGAWGWRGVLVSADASALLVRGAGQVQTQPLGSASTADWNLSTVAGLPEAQIDVAVIDGTPEIGLRDGDEVLLFQGGDALCFAVNAEMPDESLLRPTSETAAETHPYGPRACRFRVETQPPGVVVGVAATFAESTSFRLYLTGPHPDWDYLDDRSAMRRYLAYDTDKARLTTSGNPDAALPLKLIDLLEGRWRRVGPVEAMLVTADSAVLVGEHSGGGWGSESWSGALRTHALPSGQPCPLCLEGLDGQQLITRWYLYGIIDADADAWRSDDPVVVTAEQLFGIGQKWVCGRSTAVFSLNHSTACRGTYWGVHFSPPDGSVLSPWVNGQILLYSLRFPPPDDRSAGPLDFAVYVRSTIGAVMPPVR